MRENLNFLASAIGSLPHINKKEAIDLVFSTIPDAPICPQLSKINPNEDMLIQYTENFPGIKTDKSQNRYVDLNSDEYYTQLEEVFVDFEEILSQDELNCELLSKYAISENYACAFQGFIEKLKETKPEFAKGQVVGPFTFGTSTFDTENKCVFYDETYREVITKMLTLKALWQVCEFKKVVPDIQPIIFLDEPTLSQIGTSAYITVTKEDVQMVINEIADILHKFGVIVGMHCCGKADWQTILDSQLDLISFDAFSFSQNFSLFAQNIHSFLNKGGIIAWGLVPTLDTVALDNTNAEKLVEIFENTKNTLVAKGIDEDKILNASIVTPSCGAGSMDITHATKAMKMLKEVSEILKNKYCGVIK